MATDKNGKLTYQMKSPGEAWNDHVTNQMNAGAVTPSWANKAPDTNVLHERVNDLNKKVDTMANSLPGHDQQKEADKAEAYYKSFGGRDNEKARVKDKDINMSK